MVSYKAGVAFLILLLAGFNPPPAFSEPGAMGSVSVVGSVRLRETPISREGTLFSGDRIRTGEGAYARVVLASGAEIELGAGADVAVETDGEAVKVALQAGALAFSAQRSSLPLRIQVASLQVMAHAGAAGDVTFLAANVVGVRAVAGPVMLQAQENPEESPTGPDDEEEPEVLQNGDRRVITLDTTPELPEAPRPEPAAVATDDRGFPAAAWVAIAGGAGGAGALLALRGRNGEQRPPASPSRP